MVSRHLLRVLRSIYIYIRYFRALVGLVGYRPLLVLPPGGSNVNCRTVSPRLLLVVTPIFIRLLMLDDDDDDDDDDTLLPAFVKNRTMSLCRLPLDIMAIFIPPILLDDDDTIFPSSFPDDPVLPEDTPVGTTTGPEAALGIGASKGATSGAGIGGNTGAFIGAGTGGNTGVMIGARIETEIGAKTEVTIGVEN